MSVDRKELWQRIVLIAGVVFSGSALAWTSFFVSLPDRVNAQEKRLARIEEDRKTDRELLVRIEERLIAVQTDIRRHPTTPPIP